ncbi:hypothetical protein [Aeromicrobium piscarium]|uniref:Uncharacterized protein n=1 Tax=Aeromicrobium piscarium TaxID=2590901 RepID=A0A554SP26_9ACTN|nr:hypothetical protein [Aeromicrobium piscarium]TSD68090.1 hypothetical protein FNM00_00400 [Aeromicrobium piscarium]
MTSPPHALTTLAPRTSPREDVDADFDDACRRRDYPALQAHLAPMSKRDACDSLSVLFPHLSRHWIVRHFAELMAMSEDEFWRLEYRDPTGEEACRRVMAG